MNVIAENGVRRHGKLNMPNEVISSSYHQNGQFWTPVCEQQKGTLPESDVAPSLPLAHVFNLGLHISMNDDFLGQGVSTLESINNLMSSYSTSSFIPDIIFFRYPIPNPYETHQGGINRKNVARKKKPWQCSAVQRYYSLNLALTSW